MLTVIIILVILVTVAIVIMPLSIAVVLGEVLICRTHEHLVVLCSQ